LMDIYKAEEIYVISLTFWVHFAFLFEKRTQNQDPPPKIEESFKHTKKNHESFNPFDMRVIERAGDQ